MEILLIVIGGLLTLFFGTITLSCFIATKNEKNFNQLLEELDKKNAQVRGTLSDEEVYSLVCKTQNISAILLIAGILLLGLGITLIAL